MFGMPGIGRFALAHALGHVGHVAVHLEEAVYLRDLDAGALGDTGAALAVDQVGLGAFGFGHRADDADLAMNLSVVERSFGDLAFDFLDAGQHAHDALQAADLDQLTSSCFSMSSKSKRPLAIFLAIASRLQSRSTLFDGLSTRPTMSPLAEDAAGDAARVERFKRIGAFAGAEEFDRQAGDGAHRERRAAAAVAIGAREHEAGKRQALVETLGGFRRRPGR